MSNTARKFRFAYAGIGSRKISPLESETIIRIASKITSVGGLLYSGNADGADVSFQRGSGGNCVVFLPWSSFNFNVYQDPTAEFIVPEETRNSVESVGKYHLRAAALTQGARRMMLRNYHQVMGYGDYPVVRFVVCCADYTIDDFDNISIIGGTGQACRIATANDIPVFNIRRDGWKTGLETLVRGIIKGEK